MRFDLLIKHGTVIDGTGASGVAADIGVSGGRITAIAPALAGSVIREIDAGGRVVSPGFIDVHTHSDFTLLGFPGADSKVRQGITTEVVGNCGFSPAPVAPPTLGLLKEYVGFLNPNLPWDWQRLGEFYQRVSEQGCAMNFAPLVGHGAVRIAVMGFDNRPPTANELAQMQRLVGEAMEDGAFGLSSGLIYTPGCYGDTDELIALARVAGQAGGLYATHMRGEGGTLEEAIAEALRIGEEARIPVQISHLKASGRENWGKMERALRMLEEGCEQGIAVTADIYPYIAGSTTMTSLFPAWALEGGVERFLTRLGDPDARPRIIDEVQGGREGWSRANGSVSWDDILVSSCQYQKQFEGQTVAQIATAMAKSPPDAMMDFLLAEHGKASIILFMMSEDNVARGLAHPMLMIGSDSLAMAAGRGGKPHPRTYGTFPRVLGKYVRQDGLITLEDGVRKMTSMAAEKFGLTDRGVLAEGKVADITIFDAATVADLATFAEPHQYPAGIDCVIVNGQVVVEHGVQHPVLPGQVLKKD
ncbi:D-aminoacylase [Candidatus Entotheonellaceae bacterium PAL068K]